jgi:tight adherence protein B
MLPLLAAALITMLVASAWVLIRVGAARSLHERVRSISGPSGVEVSATLPSIRVQASGHGEGLGRFFRLLRYRPEIPQAQLVPWPLVLVASLALGGFAFFQAGSFVSRWLALPIGLATAVMAARGIFGWQHARYCNAVFQQIPEAIGLMVRAIRAGLPLAEALRSISREMSSPTKDEFARVVGDMAIGRPVDVALMRLHERTGLTEYSFLAVTLGLQAQTGGSLAETLENLGDMVRKRVALAKRAQALAGEAKVQAGMLLVMPFLAAIGLSFIQPFYISAFTQNPTGRTLLVVGFCLMLMGVFSIRWLIQQAGKE